MLPAVNQCDPTEFGFTKTKLPEIENDDLISYKESISVVSE
jgi:hypothetical protein